MHVCGSRRTRHRLAGHHRTLARLLLRRSKFRTRSRQKHGQEVAQGYRRHNPEVRTQEGRLQALAICAGARASHARGCTPSQERKSRASHAPLIVLSPNGQVPHLPPSTNGPSRAASETSSNTCGALANLPLASCPRSEIRNTLNRLLKYSPASEPVQRL